MNLYVNGCSFTHGHKDFGGTDTMRPDSPPTWVWPSMLIPNFDTVVNQAWRGTCNNRIVRRTIDYLSKVNNPADWWVVIQWTSLERSEWFDYDTHSWYTQLLHRVVYDDWAVKGLEEQPRINRKGEIAVPYVNNIRTDEHKVLDLFYQTITLDTFLKQRGFDKVLYTGMSKNCMLSTHMNILKETIQTEQMVDDQHIHIHSPNVHLFDQLYSLLQHDRYVQPLSVVTAGMEESSEDGHPNKQGHEVFSRYILNEMENRA